MESEILDHDAGNAAELRGNIAIKIPFIMISTV